MSGYAYTSAFAGDISAFLAFKKDMGIQCRSREWHLMKFDRHCAERGLDSFNSDTVEGWVKQCLSQNPESVHTSWMSYIRDLGRFMRTNGNRDAYVLSDRFKSKLVRVEPYILSSAEVEAFFKSAKHVMADSPWAWEAYCFFGLMYSCGLRTCEVRRLAVGDVDSDKGVIDILWSKGSRSRRLPISEEVACMLAECDTRTRSVINPRSTFFVSSTGKPVAPSSVGVMFNRIWDRAGLPRPDGGKRPRPYDLRHHFAYANIERWAAEGRDVESLLPYLARYMGHASFDSTYYYVHTSPDFLAGYAAAVRGCESLFPEVGFYD